MTGNGQLPRVAIVGGGFTGAAVATHLALRASAPLAVDVIEPRAMLGGGVAYSSLDPAHRTNVAAARMSLFTDDEDHFMRWLGATRALADDPEAVVGDGRVYPRRRVFGHYVADQLERAARSGRAVVRHLRDRAMEILPRRRGWTISLGSGRTVDADLVVLTVSHPPPQPPGQLLRILAEQPGFVPDPWALDALKPIMPMDTVLIMGAALSMADVVASLELQGHRGRIIAFSRRGLLSRAHAASAHQPFSEFAVKPATTALEILRQVRQGVAAAEHLGLPWQSVVDAVRRDGQVVWHALNTTQRRALLRHLRPFWEVHRYRVAPQVGTVIDRRLANGSLEVIIAGLGEVEIQGGRIRTELRLRGRQGGSGRRWVEADAFVVTTGPAHGGALQSNPALRSLSEPGHIQADDLGLGLLVDRQHRAVPRLGPTPQSLLVAGPLARGTFGELMGLPQVAQHAQDVATAALAQLPMGVTDRSYPAVGADSISEYVDFNTRHYPEPRIPSVAAS